MVLMNLFTGQHGYADIENRLMDTGGGGRRVGWNEWREQHGSIYTTMCKIDNGNLLCDSGKANWSSIRTERAGKGWELREK